MNNNTNNGQITTNSDYTVNTESLFSQPSSYFQNNNSAGGWNNSINSFGNSSTGLLGGNTSGWSSNTGDLGGNINNGFNQNTNFGANSSFTATPTLQNQTQTPWSYNEPQTTPTPWNTTNSTPTPWNNGINYPQQITTSTPWDNPVVQISPVPWKNNQTITPWAGGYDLSAPEQSNSLDLRRHPYIFSDDMRNRLGELESGNNYTKINSEGGGIGALGKYQIRRDGFKDAGYINANNKWAGKNDINPELQEQALNDFMKAKYRQLQSNGSRQYLGYSINGLINNFDITDTGLLAASHREGAGAVHNYLSHLEKDRNGRYYINYDKIRDQRQREMFKRIETRLRKFEK